VVRPHKRVVKCSDVRLNGTVEILYVVKPHESVVKCSDER
jgi:hypothetical protein